MRINYLLTLIVGFIFIVGALFMDKPAYCAAFTCLSIIFVAIGILLPYQNLLKGIEGEDAYAKQQDKMWSCKYTQGVDPIENSVEINRENYKRIIIAGAAGSGKDYLRDKLKEKGLSIDVSYTTRPMRDGEIAGETYTYITDFHFKHLQNNRRFYESVEFNGARYGTLKDSWESSMVFIMTPSGIKHITEDDIKDCIIVYLDIDETIRRERMQKRSDGGFDKIERRIQADNEDFKYFVDVDILVRDPLFESEFLIEEILNKASYTYDGELPF